MAESPSDVISVLESLIAGDPEKLVEAKSYAILARLRRFNRDAHAIVNEQRQTTLDARNSMDQAHLGLQNLLYERRHFEREIQKCKQFQFIYHDVPLYDLEEFSQLAPEASQTIDDHDLMKNRLEFEFTERARLQDRLKALTAERDRLLKLKKETRVKMEAQAREETELAKAKPHNRKQQLLRSYCPR
ncbi:hypothetical protein DL93DRAFT_2088598 [Clavulina sp. PMI_390]|nr:hypothetical protein DL93DRAFT_2088598 [Clavulina sp. PMI_390]